MDLEPINLRNLLANQLQQAGWTVEDNDRLTDGSGSWIQAVRDNKPKKKKRFIVLGFDGSGNVLTEVKVYEAEYKLQEQDAKRIF